MLQGRRDLEIINSIFTKHACMLLGVLNMHNVCVHAVCVRKYDCGEQQAPERIPDPHPGPMTRAESDGTHRQSRTFCMLLSSVSISKLL